MKVFRLVLAPALATLLTLSPIAAFAKATPVVAARNTIAEQAALGVAQAQWQMGQQALTAAKTPAAQRHALVWFGLAAMNGHLQAAVKAAQLLEARNQWTEAARWWYRAGQLGDSAARARLVELFQHGKTNGTIPGRDAVPWLAERATTSRDSVLKLALGDAFAFGLWLLNFRVRENR